MPRRLGQHFLIRERTLARIASAACPAPGAMVLEIGAGTGALTRRLLDRAARVIAVEIDDRLADRLAQRFAGDTRLEIVQEDIRGLDLARWGAVTVAGNLPYYATSPIIERVLGLGALLERAVLLVQKEVAHRLIATPGGRDYGFLTVRTQLFARAEMLFTVPPQAFRPPPKVDSAVVLLTPRTLSGGFDYAAFLEFAGLCFHHKRKTLRNNLSGAYPREALADLGSTRAEELALADLVALFEKLRGAR
ncbi:MAG: 16S rRNA (adenine(1518)-N(6)/adenine(1519)-N(6))-dimethyltransferase RsmA [Bryobacteraceae bacterium]